MERCKMDKKIEKLLEKWDEMLDAMTELKDGFTIELDVTVRSDKSLTEQRVKIIDGLAKSFDKHNIEWVSD